MNHQPCRTYLQNSTRMSLAVSLAGIALESSNVALERILLDEMDGGRISFDFFATALMETEVKFGDILHRISVLRIQMRDEGYIDLPTIHDSRLDVFIDNAVAARLLQGPHALNVLQLYRSKTFDGVLSDFEQQVNHLALNLRTLSQQLRFCQGKVGRNHTLEAELEHNGVGNLRPAFALLYTAWTNFHQFFLASSLVSTEAWYMHENAGSLLDDQTAISAAA
jgi:hypothetical protein